MKKKAVQRALRTTRVHLPSSGPVNLLGDDPLDVSGGKMDTMLCDIVDAEEVLNLIYQVAPGENNTVRSLFTDPCVEELSFPTLFGGYS